MVGLGYSVEDWRVPAVITAGLWIGMSMVGPAIQLSNL